MSQEEYIKASNPNTPPAFELGRVRTWFESILQSEGINIGMLALDHNNMDGYLEPNIQQRWVDFKRGYELANNEARTVIAAGSWAIGEMLRTPKLSLGLKRTLRYTYSRIERINKEVGNLKDA